MAAEHWIRAADYADVPEEDTLGVAVGDLPICLYRLGAEIFATDNKCTHGDADLSEGLIQDGCEIECPLHEGRFDIRSGKAVSAPCTEDLRSYPARVEDGVVYIRLVCA
ncbi:Rieske 2Fe-2S domain-containing protein [Bordetella petrii]|uniref:non-heme iron oxygenase ferredoxin subunit n=1 Tax=Bordetella petrii TaxID=94624 RepID=UPI001A957B9C|nr:non-heme iron oxygenase ferredoxin subunit [Bordetella petrii]MBO1110847.1 non-heme iron oxygenase ferredoxin subunit [Bordetella petrii]MBO9352883.1 Rieske 2Fe-2S domain-containing protein [Bordetella petrii]